MGGCRGSRRRLLAVAAAAVALLVFATALGAHPAAAELLHARGDPAAQQWRRRLFVGPGSSPPTCRGRCGRCFPCRPIHVAVQPGKSVTLEYYPEAWRCKCGSKLYMP